MPDFQYAKGRIGESIRFISEEIKEFEKDYLLIEWKEYQENKKLQKLMDRTVENILTALIEVCGTVLVQENISVDNYAEVLQKCSAILGFTEEQQNNLSKLAIQRNRLAHRYLNFRYHAVKMFKEQKGLVIKLVNGLSAREEKLELRDN